MRPSARPKRRWWGSNPRQKGPADLRADSLTTMPPTSPNEECEKLYSLVIELAVFMSQRFSLVILQDVVDAVRDGHLDS
ncbi:hypothetical protein PoB_000383200 [Plakobranchus ocellatus]|uniref:Uncharacterized protein n=1 Tax=Plakobranchus ocellatus TaxID=259542 RepID=A0AAV3Y3M6_9GAST|nr:hypothetical protein PoB_000383200 [Plakobranchus ocellatus]